jgi:hypothetical protein
MPGPALRPEFPTPVYGRHPDGSSRCRPSALRAAPGTRDKERKMKVKVEGRVKDAALSEYRCRDFVSLSFFVDGKPVALSDTVSDRYELVDADAREREMLRSWGYRVQGL